MSSSPNLLDAQRYLIKYLSESDTVIKFRGKPCEWCGKVRTGPSGRLCRVCVHCEARYCSDECRKTAWRNGHWMRCGPATKIRGDVRCGIAEDVA